LIFYYIDQTLNNSAIVKFTTFEYFEKYCY
jgi:hypothetical protein